MVRPDQMPYRRQLLSTAEPVVLSEGDYSALLRRVADGLDLDAIEARRARGERVGYGIAAFLEKSGLGPWESGSVTVEDDGSVMVRTGCSSVGQGLRTILAQIAADGLEIEPDRVRVELLDTGRIDYGTGSYASRSTATAGSAVHLAVRAVPEKARFVAAAELATGADPLTYRAGGFETADGARRLSLGELAALLDPVRATRLGLTPGLSATEHFHVERITYPYGAHAAVVRVDEDTGGVVVERVVLGFDVGRAVNPMLVEGQLHGGAAQAVGGALLEEFRYDGSGNPIASTFMDYLLPTMAEVPEMTAIISEDAPAKHNPLGVKGAGEGGITGLAAAIAGAIDHALDRPGLVRRLPITPARLRAAIDEWPAGEGSSSGPLEVEPHRPGVGTSGVGDAVRDRRVVGDGVAGAQFVGGVGELDDHRAM
jgi:aerobic carbon-monoxide dehydrogenase large subunit